MDTTKRNFAKSGGVAFDKKTEDAFTLAYQQYMASQEKRAS